MSKLSILAVRRCGVALVVAAGVATSSSTGHAQAPAGSEPPADAVAARVNGLPITYAEVKRQIAAAFPGGNIPGEALPLVFAQSLEQVIGRRLITAKLRELKLEPTPDELKQAEANLEANLAQRGVSRDDYLRQNALSAADLEELRYWEICWNRHAAEHLTDAAIEKFFQEHRREFDGTELRVSHILLRVEGLQDQATRQAAVEKAARIREEIVGNQIAFAEAARKYSAGPSREQGGDLGFIPRHGRMVEDFSAAAFKLAKGEVSPPVLTSFGAHLITVTDEKAGTIDWQSIKSDLADAAKKELFQSLAAELRRTAKVEFTGLVPHFDPATKQIVMPR